MAVGERFYTGCLRLLFLIKSKKTFSNVVLFSDGQIVDYATFTLLKIASGGMQMRGTSCKHPQMQINRMFTPVTGC